MLLTNNLRKYIKSLHQNKFRQKYNKFIAEGPKIAMEFLESSHYTIDSIFCTQEWYTNHQNQVTSLEGKTFICSNKDLKSISLLQNPNKILIVCDIPKSQDDLKITDNPDEWILYLDRLQDPGNMGTIIRIADWYNVKSIISTSDSVNYYNPKVVQSAMGGHNRVHLHTCDPESMSFENYNVLALALEGEDIHFFKRTQKTNLLVIGNESQGIRSDILRLANQKLHIPKRGGAESLNASVACGIACHTLINFD